MDRPALLVGVASALGAGLAWGLVFVAPLILPDYPPALLACGRYIAFGMIALIPAWLDRRRMARLTRADWLEAMKLGLVGNLLYYTCLASAIQLAGAPVPTMIIGTLPLVIAVFANLGAERVSWRRLAVPMGVLAGGLLLVNHHEMRQLEGAHPPAGYGLGILAAVAALACWTWYPLRNAAWLKAHAAIAPGSWATAQGLASLPPAIGGYLAWGMVAGRDGAFAWPLGPRPLIFVVVMLLIGLLASWLGTLLWNRASRLLPAALVGQLIVFETLAALVYAFALRGALPDPATALGIALLIAGVLLGVNLFRRRPLSAGSIIVAEPPS